MKKNKIFFVILAIVLVLAIVIVTIMQLYYKKSIEQSNLELYNGLPVNISRATYMYDTSTPEKAVGISDYVFVAKINEITRTEHRNPITVETGLFSSKTITTPYTFYSIEVIKNIKGELITSEPIEYMQYGGLNEDGKSYTFMEGTELLETGKYYIIMADTFGEDGGDINVTEPNRRILLEDVNNIEDVENSELVKRYEEAYKNEIIPEGFDTNDRYTSKYDVNYNG